MRMAYFLFGDFKAILPEIRKIRAQIPDAKFEVAGPGECSEGSAMVSISWDQAVESGFFKLAARTPSCSFLPCGGGYFRPAYRVYGQKVLKPDSLYCKASGSIARLHNARVEQKRLFAMCIGLGLSEQDARRLAYISAYSKK